MITTENFRDLLLAVGYKNENDIFSKKFDNDTIMAVDFNKQLLIFPKSIRGGDRNNGFDKNENFVVFECVDKLLNHGYRACDIELEKQWHLGHDLKSGRADICITGPDGKMLLIIECKTFGAEYNKALRDTKNDGGQLFSYWQQEGSTKWLALYASDFENNTVKYEITTIRSEDDSQLLQVAKSDSDILLYKNAFSVPDKFRVWDETYKKESYGDLIFSKDTVAYNIGVKPLLKRDLKDFTPDDKIVNKFEEILRHNNVSDKENAFNRLVALFICKLVDEIESADSDEVRFQYKSGTDTYETLQDRLQNLYKIGMDKFMHEDIFYVESDYAEHLFENYIGKKRKKVIEELNKTIRQLKFFSNNDFAFKEVHNDQLFYQNGKILVEIVELFQKYRIVYPSKHQFLGDLFELLLNKGFKQNEGQFFTPMPITRFIWDSLPLSKETNQLPRVIDYACGAGHFLIEGIEAINHHYNVVSSDWVSKSIYGIEKDYRLARVSKVSMFMNGAGESNIIFGDGLENYTDKGIIPHTFDILVANPPYSVKGFKEHLKIKNNTFELLDKISTNGSDIESLFVERIAQLVKSDGMVAVILPSSILQSGGSYAGAREHLLKYFHLHAIVELGSQTFGATGTNTVILFMQKRHEPPVFYDMVLDSVEAMISGDDTEWTDNKVLNDYLLVIGKTREQWNEYIHNLSDKELNIERNRLIYWTLVFGERVLVITAPSGNAEQKQFLGYEWSNAKGGEGIHIITPGGMLYDENNRDNKNTLAGLIRESFNNEYNDLPHLSQYYHWVNLTDMLNWQKKSFDNAIRTTATSKIEINTKWQTVKLGEVIFENPKSTIQVNQAKDNITGNYPFYTSGLNVYRYDSPLISGENIFIATGGNATIQYYNGQASYSTDTWVIKSNDETKLLTRVLYYLLSSETDNINRVYFKGIGLKHLQKDDFREFQIPLPTMDIQKKIVDECSALDNIITTNQQTIKSNNDKIKEIITNVKAKQSYVYEVLSLEYGKALPEKSRISGEYPVVGSNGIIGYHNNFFLNGPNVIVGRKGSVGKVKYIEQNCTPIDTAFYVKIIDNKLLLKYCFYMLSNLNLEQFNNGLGPGGVNRNTIYQLQIPVPSLTEQQKIVDLIEPFENENMRLQSEIDSVPDKKKAILDKYL